MAMGVLVAGLALAPVLRGQDRAGAADPRRLTAALAAAMAENDQLRSRLDGRALAASPSGLGGVSFAERDAKVLDANPALGMVVMDAGGRQGVRVGMVLTVLRDRRALARVRVTDVRRRVAGAVVEEVLPGSPYPGPGDRLVVTTDGE